MIVVDASAILELLLHTPRGERVRQRLFGRREELHAPHLVDLEVCQVVRRYTLAGELSAVRALEALTDFLDLPLTRHAHDFLVPRIWELHGNATAYDAAYLVLAEALPARLVTCDARLARAPGHAAKTLLIE